MAEQTLNPGAILSLSAGYWRSCAVHAAVMLYVFGPLAQGGLSSKELADRLSCDAGALGRLCTALAALKLLDRRGETFSLNEISRTFLLKDAPRSIVHILRHHRNLAPTWTRLDTAVRAGRPPRSSGAWEGEEREDFLMGMFNLAMGIAPRLSAELPLSGRKRLLDLGGGPGTYAIHFCLARPRLSAVIFDLPTTEPVAQKTVARFGVADRVGFAPGDYLEDPLPRGFDAVWLSQILHGEGEADCRRILAKAAGALNPGGLLFVHEFFLDDSLDGPEFPALFSLNMLLVTEQGRSYAEGEMRAMLAEAGIIDIRRLPFRGPNDSGILCGVKG